MADIVLKDRDGNDVPYEGANALIVYDTNGNPAMFTFGDGTTNWDDIKDRPFYEEVYEDSYDFTVVPTVYFDAVGNRFYKISDLTLTYDQLLKTEFTLVIYGNTISTVPAAETFILNSSEVVGFVSNDVGIGIAYTNGEIETAIGVLNVPETGTYFGFPLDSDMPSGTVISFRYEDLKKLDAKFLPDEITKLEGLPQVGSDDNGKHLVVNNGEWTAQEVLETKELPTVTADDNGKLLQVVDGTWAAVTITNGNEVAY